MEFDASIEARLYNVRPRIMVEPCELFVHNCRDVGFLSKINDKGVVFRIVSFSVIGRTQFPKDDSNGVRAQLVALGKFPTLMSIELKATSDRWEMSSPHIS